MTDNIVNINLDDMNELGDNVLSYKSGDKIILVIDATKRLGPSASGKTTIVASTRGNVPLAGLIFGINVYTKGK